MITWKEEGIWQMETGISLWAKVMYGNIAATEYTNQISGKNDVVIC